MASSAETTLNQSGALAPPPGRPIAEYQLPARPRPDLEARSLVDISPSEIVRRHCAAWSGVHVETVQVMRHMPFEYGFRAPYHLLIAAELAERYDGETFVEGLPRSTLRDFTRKLTFVPAGHDYHEWQRPRALTRFMYVYVDPAQLQVQSELDIADVSFTARLFFQDATLWDTALKLMRSIETPAFDRRYSEA